MLRTLRIRRTRQCGMSPPLGGPPSKKKSPAFSNSKSTASAWRADGRNHGSSSSQRSREGEDKQRMETRDSMHSTTITSRSSSDPQEMVDEDTRPAKIMIAGGGIVGLLLALALEKHLNVKPEIYEQSHGFDPDVGAGMGLYANGLRVIQDIEPELLLDFQKAGHPYLYRRWERHDGTEVAVADERVLGCQPATTKDVPEGGGGLHTMGIRRWRLQQLLHSAVQKAGIPIYFSKKVLTITTPDNGTTEVVFTDGTRRETQLLIGADGGRSTVRATMLKKAFQDTYGNQQQQDDIQEKAKKLPKLSYTGVTCIMGVAENRENLRDGISFPVSNTTRCHGAFYPTGANEQCFQFHFPIQAKQEPCSEEQGEDSCWGNLSQQVSREECSKLADILKADGWDEEKYLKPLRQVTRAVRVGFCQLTPALKHWSFPNAHGQPRTILVGDAAHPPVPYIGQGAQQGMEDVGTLALLLKSFCLDDQGALNLRNLDYAVKVYESLRIHRVAEVLENGKVVGDIQEKRAQNPAYNIIKEEMIQRDIFFHETITTVLACERLLKHDISLLRRHAALLRHPRQKSHKGRNPWHHRSTRVECMKNSATQTINRTEDHYL